VPQYFRPSLPRLTTFNTTLISSIFSHYSTTYLDFLSLSSPTLFPPFPTVSDFYVFSCFFCTRLSLSVMFKLFSFSYQFCFLLLTYYYIRLFSFSPFPPLHVLFPFYGLEFLSFFAPFPHLEISVPLIYENSFLFFTWLDQPSDCLPDFSSHFVLFFCVSGFLRLFFPLLIMRICLFTFLLSPNFSSAHPC